MDDEIQRLTIRETWEVVTSKSVAYHNVHPETWSFKCKRKPDWNIRKFKARYFVRGDVQKRLYPETLNLYSPMVQWSTVSLMLIYSVL